MRQQTAQLQQQLQKYEKAYEDLQKKNKQIKKDLLVTSEKEKKYCSLLLEHNVENLDSVANSPIRELADKFPDYISMSQIESIQA